MKLFLRVIAVLGIVCVTSMTYSQSAEACWLSRVFTSSYYDVGTCCPAPVTQTCCTVPQTYQTTSYTTSNVQRCQMVPQTRYVTRTQVVPYTSVVRRSYWDPVFCRYRSYMAPVTQYTQRSYSVPVTSYVQQCSYEPVTTCPTEPEPVYTTAVYDSCGRLVDVRRSSSPSSASQEAGAGGIDERQSGYGKNPEATGNEAPKPTPNETGDGVPKPEPIPAAGEGENGSSTMRSESLLQFTSLVKRVRTSWRPVGSSD